MNTKSIELQLEKLRVGVEQRVIKRMLEDTIHLHDGKVAAEDIGDQIAFTLKATVLGKKSQRVPWTVTTSALVFASWWDHFKAMYGRRWWLKWMRLKAPSYKELPVVMNIKHHQRDLFPYATVPHSFGERVTIHFLEQTNPPAYQKP
jgi:hypothetical protein